jgi:hypothetical protein
LAVANYGEVVTESGDIARGGGAEGNTMSGTAIVGDTSPSSSSTTPLDKVDESAATVRGNRYWKDPTGCESVALCCSRCCSPIGFAALSSPEIWRFWKHRLSTSSNSKIGSSLGTNYGDTDGIVMTNKSSLPPSSFPNDSGSMKAIGSVSSFLIREMVRYAESKAIFTFLVGRETHDTTRNNVGSKCLLLRLLSWETTIAKSPKDSTKWKSHVSLIRNTPSLQLNFEKVAKLIFEETVDRADLSMATNSDSTTQWIWGGVDLCCPPAASSSNRELPFPSSNPFNPSTNDGTLETPTGSSVRLNLPKYEYDQVLTDLSEGRSFFSKTHEDATILLKMGRERTNGMGLTMVRL